MAAAALAVTDELALPLRAVGDLAAAAGVSREEVVVITQCASLGIDPGSRMVSVSSWVPQGPTAPPVLARSDGDPLASSEELGEE